MYINIYFSILFPFAHGKILVFAFLKAITWTEFVNFIESGVIIVTASFTSIWTYRTFSINRRHLEAENLIEALDEYLRCYERAHSSEKELALLMSQISYTGELKKIYQDSIEDIETDLRTSENTILKLFKKSFTTSDRLRARIFMLVSTYSQTYSKEDFRKELISLQGDLRDEASMSLF